MTNDTEYWKRQAEGMDGEDTSRIFDGSQIKLNRYPGANYHI